MTQFKPLRKTDLVSHSALGKGVGKYIPPLSLTLSKLNQYWKPFFAYENIYNAYIDKFS